MFHAFSVRRIDHSVAATSTHVPLNAAVPHRASMARLSVTSLMLLPACCCGRFGGSKFLRQLANLIGRNAGDPAQWARDQHRRRASPSPCEAVGRVARTAGPSRGANSGQGPHPDPAALSRGGREKRVCFPV